MAVAAGVAVAEPWELTLDDIADQRAYEREREEFRRRVIAVKKKRRVPVGPVVTITFESRLTMRFQVQEMARAEKMVTDDQILHELAVYNRLIPAPGELSATLFLELTSEDELRRWLPALVGIESSLVLRISTAPGGPDGGAGAAEVTVRGVPEEDHRAALTRPDVTSAVHYVRFSFTPDEVEAFRTGVVALAVDHPAYPDGAAGVVLGEEIRAELLADLEGRSYI